MTRRAPGDGPAYLKHSPFAGLASLVPREAPAQETAADPRPSKPAPAKEAPRRAVVRFERKGRGGKEVTVVDKLGLVPAALDDWLRSMKQSLGTGGAVEDGTLVVQGDQRDRVAAWLAERGVADVTVAR